MYKPLKPLLFLVLLGIIIYNVVDDKTREKFDVGLEGQKIALIHAKNESYYFIWEFLGAYDTEVKAQREKDEDALYAREEAYREHKEKIDGDRGPAYDDSHKWDKFVH